MQIVPTTAPARASAASDRLDLSGLPQEGARLGSDYNKRLTAVVLLASLSRRGLWPRRIMLCQEGESATVVFEGGERAKVIDHIAGDPIKDVAVLRIDTKKKLKSLELASNLPAAGEPVASFKPDGGGLYGEVEFSVNDDPPPPLVS